MSAPIVKFEQIKCNYVTCCGCEAEESLDVMSGDFAFAQYLLRQGWEYCEHKDPQNLEFCGKPGWLCEDCYRDMTEGNEPQVRCLAFSVNDCCLREIDEEGRTVNVRS